MSEFFSDANLPAREIIATDHRLQLQAQIDADMAGGEGATKIIGLRRQPGVTVTELGGGNAAAPSLGDVADAIYRIEAADAKPNAIFMHPRTWNVLKKLQDLKNRYQLQPDPTQAARRSLFGLPVFVSSQISIAETVGSSNDCSYIVVADMSRVVVVKRAEMIVLYDPYSHSTTDQVVVQSISRFGFGILEAAVEVITGVRT